MREKKVKLIYNPAAGDHTFPDYLDEFIARFQQAGYRLDIFRSLRKGDLSEGLENIDEDKYESIFLAGGDGSINIILNAMMEKSIDLPLGIIPAGTANDFASFLNMPDSFEDCFDLLLKRNLYKVDIGCVNNKYFINDCVGGLFSSVSHKTPQQNKNRLGMFAYYMNGVRKITELKPIPLKITTAQEVIKDNFYLFLILNSKGAGGFRNLAPDAEIDDGLFDFIGVKSRNIFNLSTSVIDFLRNKKPSNDSIIYRQSNYYKIERFDNNQNKYCDTDGEEGPPYPLEVKVLPQALTVFKNKN
ncbi:MAG: diacylglycerol/lipid kinase family protein [Halothermotrichaceae bacterium]